MSSDHPKLIGLPSRPRFKRYVMTCFPRDDYILMHGPGLFLSVRDDDVRILSAMMKYMDGTHTVEEIAEGAGTDVAKVREILTVLLQNSLLEDGADDAALGVDDATAAYFKSQRTLFSLYLDRTHVPQRHLADADVLVIGLDPAGAATAEALVASGVGKVTVVDGRSVTAEDAVAPTLAGRGGTRAAAFAEALADHPSGSTVEAIDVDPTDLDVPDLEPHLEGRDLVIASPGARDAEFFNRLNEAAIKADVPWLPLYMQGPVAYLGPITIPRRSPCWRCREIMFEGFRPTVDWGERYLQNGANGGAWGALPSFGAIAGGTAANLAVVFLSKLTPPSIAQELIVVDLLSSISRSHRVFRMPQCPACTPSALPDLDRYSIEPINL